MREQLPKMVVDFIRDEPGGLHMMGDTAGIDPDKAQRLIARGICRPHKPSKTPPPLTSREMKKRALAASLEGTVLVRFNEAWNAPEGVTRPRGIPLGGVSVGDVLALPKEIAAKVIKERYAEAYDPKKMAPVSERRSPETKPIRMRRSDAKYMAGEIHGVPVAVAARMIASGAALELDPTKVAIRLTRKVGHDFEHEALYLAPEEVDAYLARNRNAERVP